MLRWAHSQNEEIKADGYRLLFFPDISASLAKQRATFRDIKAKLYTAGITFSLHPPARLCVTFNGDKHFFNTPEAAETFYRQINGSFATNTDEEQG